MTAFVDIAPRTLKRQDAIALTGMVVASSLAIGGTLSQTLQGQHFFWKNVAQSTQERRANHSIAQALLRSTKEMLGYTNAQLAAQFTVTRQTIQNWLRGEEPRSEHLSAIRNLNHHARRLAEAGAIEVMWELRAIPGMGECFAHISAMDAKKIGEATDILIREAAIIARQRTELDAIFRGS